ncbi:hypothetical protein MINS_34890 [Mycolicibacterium insubricum]|uniref:Fatty-acid--CoA ligase n=1 Tax=Mycolicibacterium insubricum TaxID=444597 RepID=A0A1X0DG06_9MYCO|nr:fatty-acid--CoA ligase [Mycolicibacterium insubricum]MCV7080185.1 fatty-acid--CoA ligase [Mycolicibacterium insubricum]ORA71331.1 fatty-acid--CoA ligase [Mycolicibacterium insubricum]BBZ68060.1 hypothetical protein MINS_34890 [Mycolicibacterium insubricum]
MPFSDVYRHSLVLASDFRIPDPDRVRPLLVRNRDRLVDLGAHHAMVYRSIRDPGRVLVMLGVRSREPITELLRSGVFHEWFDAVGITDFPAVFAGEILARFDFTEHREPDPGGHAVIAAMASVDDVGWLTARIRASSAEFAGAGIRKVWVFGAFDDPGEVLILQEADDEASARAWVRRHDPAADWMSEAGTGVYPSLFVGEYVGVVEVS